MIRPFLMKDLNSVMDIWLRSCVKAYPFLNKQQIIELYEPFQTDHLLQSQSNVLEIDGKIVGFISIKQTMEISALYVDPQVWRQGVGEKLLDFLFTKYHRLHCKVYEKNTIGLNFFGKNGFSYATRDVDELTGQSQLVLLRDLSEEKRFAS